MNVLRQLLNILRNRKQCPGGYCQVAQYKNRTTTTEVQWNSIGQTVLKTKTIHYNRKKY